MTTATATSAPTSTTPTSGSAAPTAPATKEPVKTETTTVAPGKEPVKTQEPAGEDDLLTGSEPKGTDGSGATATEVELTVPDGIEVDKGMLDGFRNLAKEANIGSKEAQKILDFYVGNVKQAEEQIKSTWNDTKAKWRETASKDKEIGGADFKANVEIARKAIDKLGGPGLKQALRDLDIGNHPEIIRFAYRVGKALSEDSLSDAGSKPVASSDEESMYRSAFPSMFEKTEE